MGEYIKGSGTDRFVFREVKKLTEPIVAPKVEFKTLSDVLQNRMFLKEIKLKVLRLFRGFEKFED
ncbi:hypothetical protein [Paenibacillus sp. TC-CSREp1]|uniref:hypothetical protein n=1 Tax=Paenibacillus sp. TC-CSREp1 TaxID=3410089 RepID=UPI003CE84CE9